jgi:hypothetical protein
VFRKRHVGPLTSPLDWIKFLTLEVGAEILSVMGVFWLIINVVRFFFPRLSPYIQSLSILGLVLVIGILVGLWRRWPIKRVSKRIPGRDVEIEIRIEEMFSIPGDYIISTTTSFDTDLTNGTVSPDSLIGQFVKRFYPNSAHLDYDIEQALNGIPFTNLPETWPGKKKRYKIGTVAQVKVQEHTVYLVGIADKNQAGNVSDQSSFEDVKTSLAMTWEHIRQRGDMGTIVIGLMGTGRARMNVTRMDAFKEIVKSFIAANSDKKLCEKLIIVIHPEDYKKHDLDFSQMWDYLRSACTVTEFRTATHHGAGTPLYLDSGRTNELQPAQDG